MDTREVRGRQIAQTQKVIQSGPVWFVPSQSGNGKYAVRLGEKPSCSCPDYELRQDKCKHVYAVEFSLTMSRVENNADGTTTATTVEVKVRKQTYPQPWREYNLGQTNERGHFHELLADLCSAVPEPAPKGGKKGGRPTIPLRDSIFSAVLKVYSLTSARRFTGELKEAHEAGYIGRLPHFNSVLSIFDREETTPILRDMIAMSSMPLRAIETKFAVDSTGFATIKYASWYDAKYNAVRRTARWVKAHFATGVSTNVVTSVQILDQDAGDSPQLPGLVKDTAKGFTVGEVSADKAYASQANFAAVEGHGGQFFPAFKSSTTGSVGGSFEKAFHYFSLKKDKYLEHYHQRSNVESTVSMVKRKFGDSVKAKNETAQKNEVYAKFVCHNLCVLIAEMYAQGINPRDFGTRPACTETDPAAQILRFPGR